MEQDKRSEPRLEITSLVEVDCPDGSRLQFETTDLSDHGAYLRQTGSGSLPSPGSEIRLRPVGLFGDRSKTYRAEVVDSRPNGIGIRFL